MLKRARGASERGGEGTAAAERLELCWPTWERSGLGAASGERNTARGSGSKGTDAPEFPAQGRNGETENRNRCTCTRVDMKERAQSCRGKGHTRETLALVRATAETAATASTPRPPAFGVQSKNEVRG
jgi:hypothetical protein